MDIRHANSLESNSIMMTQEVGIQFPATFSGHLFYLGKLLFACNRWNHGKLKPKCDVPWENLPWEKPFSEVCVTAPIITQNSTLSCVSCEQPGPGATLLGWPKSIY